MNIERGPGDCRLEARHQERAADDDDDPDQDDESVMARHSHPEPSKRGESRVSRRLAVSALAGHLDPPSSVSHGTTAPGMLPTRVLTPRSFTHESIRRAPVRGGSLRSGGRGGDAALRGSS